MIYGNETNWYLVSDGKQERWVRLFSKNALQTLVTQYAYLDTNECLNIARHGRNLQIERGAPYTVRSSPVLNHLSKRVRDIRGVEQHASNSGICWYAAMCFVMFLSTQMTDLLVSKANDELRSHMQNVLTDRKKAEALRHHLYFQYALGDRPNQNPMYDGQNGFTQLCILLAKLDIPTVRLLAPELTAIVLPVQDQNKTPLTLRTMPSPQETALLVVRNFRSKWRPRAKITYSPSGRKEDGRTYRLIGLMIGSEYCQHQIGASAVDLNMCCTWGLCDADASSRGIGPLFWTTRRRKHESVKDYMSRWQSTWEKMIPATLFGNNQVCDLNPSNRPPRALEQSLPDDRPGVVNTDFIYMSPPIK